MFIKAFMDSRVASKKHYASMEQLITDACTILRVSEDQVKRFLQCHLMYVITLVK